MQPVYALYFISLQAVMIWSLASLFQTTEVYYVANSLIGYLLYRVWAYFVGKGSKQLAVFPFSNFSSAAILFWFTLALDMPQIYTYLLSINVNGKQLCRQDLIDLNNRATVDPAV